MLFAYIASGTVAGMLVRMGNSVRAIDVRPNSARPAASHNAYQSDEQAATALQSPAELKGLLGRPVTAKAKMSED